MKILIVDTSTEKSVIAITNNNDVIYSYFFPEGQVASPFLFPAIEKGLSELNFKIKDLDAIAVSIGPGSFTGIRVGISAAKGMAFPDQIPLISFCSLSGFISDNNGPFISLIDARIGGAYILKQERKYTEIIEVGQPRLVSLQNLDVEVKEKEVVGPSFSRFKGLAKAPDIFHLANLAIEKYDNKLFENDLSPLYLT